MIPCLSWSASDSTSSKISLIKGDTSYLTRPVLATVYATVIELDSCKENNDSLRSLVTIKDARLLVKDARITALQEDSAFLSRIIDQDTLIIASWKDEAFRWEKAYKKEKGLKIGGIILGSISLAFNIFLPIYFTFKP